MPNRSYWLHPKKKPKNGSDITKGQTTRKQIVSDAGKRDYLAGKKPRGQVVWLTGLRSAVCAFREGYWGWGEWIRQAGGESLGDQGREELF